MLDEINFGDFADDTSTTVTLGIWIAGDVRFVIKGSFDPVALGTLIASIRQSS